MKKALFGIWLFLYTALAFAGVQVPAYNNLPYFVAYMGSSSLAIGSGTPTKVPVNTIIKDTGGYFSTVNNRFQPLVAGTYEATTCTDLSDTGTTNMITVTYIYKNGAAYAYAGNTVKAGTIGSNLSQCTTAYVALNGSTDYIEPWVTVSSATAPTINGGTAPMFTYFEAKFIGP